VGLHFWGWGEKVWEVQKPGIELSAPGFCFFLSSEAGALRRRMALAFFKGRHFSIIPTFHYSNIPKMEAALYNLRLTPYVLILREGRISKWVR